MRTKRQLKNIITELELWLEENSLEHEARPLMQEKLKKAKAELQLKKEYDK